MDIKEAMTECLKLKKMITRRKFGENLRFYPFNNEIVVFAIKQDKVGRGWHPSAEDLIAEDWYVTNEDYLTDKLSVILGSGLYY